MKNRIITILLLICIVFSMIPMNVFAYTNEATTIEWEKTIYKGDTYVIEYWHPKGYDKIEIYNISGSSNNRNYYFVYSNKDTKFTENDRFSITNSSVIMTSAIGRSYMAPTFETLSQNTNDLLFNPNDTPYRNNTFNKITADTNETYKFIDYKYLDGGYKILESGTEGFEILYEEWYYKTYNKYPPLVSEYDETEYMKGNYYIIAKQQMITPSKNSGGSGTDIDSGLPYKTSGYVETCDDVNVYADDGSIVYVVISTEKASGDYLNVPSGSFWDTAFGTIKEFLTHNIHLLIPSVASTYNKMADVIEREWENAYDGENRNDYPLQKSKLQKFTPQPMLYSDDEYLNRYYFSNLKDATKFVLYGTAGAMYDYKEEGKTHYGYGYYDIVYNNYDLDGFSKNEIPNDLYPLKRVNMILRWHEENVYEREYLWISFDYYPYAATLSTEKKLTISQKLNPKYYIAYKTEENAEGFVLRDFLQYQETDKYDTPSIQHFIIYHPELEEKYISSSWDLKWCDVNMKMFKKTYDEDGNLIIGSGSIYEDEWIIEHMTGEDDKEYIHNSLTDEYTEKGKEEHPFTDEDGDGIYENDLGETLDPSTLKGDLDEWYKSLKDYTSALENASALIEEFTDIINNSTKHMEELTRMLNDFFKNIPSIHKTLIVFTIIAIIIMRITRRN